MKNKYISTQSNELLFYFNRQNKTVLDINSVIIDDLQKIKTVSYVVLDTELPKVGKRNSRWSIQQNLETKNY